MANKLAGETSPYLLQHAQNPVDWYPWGDEALARAQDEDKPILLSIGYAACHWCHVMAHESFEDPATAAIMNRFFVNIKVDREERPDIDSIYMSAIQALHGQGGWPLTAFLTPEGRPFYGGTYFPPTPRYGTPSFTQVLESVASAWITKRDEIEKSAEGIAEHLSQAAAAGQEAGSLNEALFDQALQGIMGQFDSQEGGFSSAPKFPPSMTIEFLLRTAVQRDEGMALHMAEYTLKKMAYSGMYDQLGGGFARYATDNKWLVPHFEKMLYDNALLARAYLHAYQVTGDPLYRAIVEETLDFVKRDMRHDNGGFYSSYDADSEGEEGKFYVWQADEIRQALGENAPLFMARYGISDAGNWEGSNILNVAEEIGTLSERFNLGEDEINSRLQAAKERLLELREERVWPGLDDKVLTSWNGLMMAAFAEAGRVLNRADYTRIAEENARFLDQTMRTEGGRLLRTWKAGSSAKLNGYLEDYAYLADGLLALYQTTFDPYWFEWLESLAEQILEHFPDRRYGGFFDTPDDHEDLLYRPKDIQDNATPSGNAMAALVLLKLSLYTGKEKLWDMAQDALSKTASFMARFPTGFAHWLSAAAFALGDPREVAVAGALEDVGTRALIGAVNKEFRPNLVLAAGEDGDVVPLLADRPQVGGKATAYVCRRFICQAPVTDEQSLMEQLE
ncbi:MAG: thioredoxin domain-containing protein [Candidatus Promineifilaceae bacterium]|jgi:hypothetical protein